MNSPEVFPHNRDAERAVLSVLLNAGPDHADAVAQAVETLQPGAFYCREHPAIFSAIRDLRGRQEAHDLVTVSAELTATGKLNEAGGASYVAGLVDETAITVNLADYAGLVVKDWRTRQLQEACLHVTDRIRRGGVDPAEVGAWLREALAPVVSGDSRRNGASFHPVTLTELYAAEPDEVQWLAPGLVAPGRITCLAGQAKIGKTTLCAHLALAVLNGWPFLGLPTRRASVLWIGAEEHPQEVALRLKGLGLPPETPGFYVHAGPLRSTEPTLKAVAEFVTSRPGPWLIVMDSLSRIWRVENENDSRQVDTAIAPLTALARETGAGVVLLHHLKKMSEQPGIDAIRGSGDLAAAVEIAILMSRRGEDVAAHEGRRRLLTTIARLAVDPNRENLLVARDEAGTRYDVLGTPSEIAQADLEAAITAELPTGEAEGITLNEIRDRVGRAKGRRTAVLRSMVARGLIRQTGKGHKGDALRFWRPEVAS